MVNFMKQALSIVLVLAALTSAPAQAANEDLLRQATQACVFGAAVLGLSSAVVLYPAMVVGSSGVPAASLVIGNTLFGCGISALGAAAAGVYGQLYDQMFPPEEAVAIATIPAEPNSQDAPNVQSQNEGEAGIPQP
jgi:hypothetical protein